MASDTVVRPSPLFTQNPVGLFVEEYAEPRAAASNNPRVCPHSSKSFEVAEHNDQKRGCAWRRMARLLPASLAQAPSRQNVCADIARFARFLLGRN